MRTSKVYQLISLTIAVTAVMLILKSGIVQEAVRRNKVNKYKGQGAQKTCNSDSSD